MSWASIANNQTVSYGNLQDAVNNGVFTLISSIPSPSNRQSTKAVVSTTITGFDPTYPPYANKTNSQLIVKSDLYNTGVVTLSPQYGMYFTGISGTSIPSFSYPVNSLSTSNYVNQIPAQTITIVLNGTRVTTPLNLSVYVNNALINCQDITFDGAQTKNVTIPAIYASSSLSIFINSGSCSLSPPPPNLYNTSFSAVNVNRGSGQYMVAGNSFISQSSQFYSGYLYRSSDYGVTWSQTNFYGYWLKISSSDDGRYVIAIDYSGYIYLSSNYASSFTQITSIGNPGGIASWSGAALSNDGQYQIIVGNNIDAFESSAIYVSTNYGSTWSQVYLSSYNTYGSCTINENGSVFLVGGGIAGTSFILRSTDQGGSWTNVYNGIYGSSVNDISINASNGWVLASNYGTAYDGFYLVKSSNSGVSFTQINGGSAKNSWMRVALKNTVSGLALYYLGGTGTSYIQQVVGAGPAFMGTVSNLTSSPVKNWHAIACSDNGNYILAGERYGLWLSTNGGSSFNQL